MRGFRMSQFLVILLLSFISNYLSEATQNQKNLPSAVIVGTVYCDTCFQNDFSKASHFIPGARVAVQCGEENAKPTFQKEAKTNEHGEFKVHLPISVSKHVKKIKGCSVKLISSSEPYCAVASTATSSSSLHLKSKKQGIHIFSAGFFTFKPLKQPNLCSQKPSVQNSKKINSLENLLPPITINPTFLDPTIPNLPPVNQKYLPPLPFLPRLPSLPQLPPLPALPLLPGLPNLPPISGKETESTTKSQQLNQNVAHPEFFFPTPPIFPSPPPAVGGLPLPPNPFQPPSVLPPNPFQPPAPPLVNLPAIPGLTPSPPPPAFSFPFPPIPFPPSTPFPGIPPASSSSSPRKTSP